MTVVLVKKYDEYSDTHTYTQHTKMKNDGMLFNSKTLNRVIKKNWAIKRNF